ncbi:MAG: metal-dependent transcriptional regulator [Capsulimonadales bacterium]|nr:metal-dependent transcriptional regulator [Capsulimonadales bacterium]
MAESLPEPNPRPVSERIEREGSLNKATGDVLKAIYSLQDTRQDAPEKVALPSDIAARTGTSRAFVTKMLQNMERQGLIEYAPYRGARLTREGRKSAVELSRHHRLLERFLTDYLGYSLPDAHREAERMEHVISEQFEERLDAFMNFPDTCPHGAPIPNPDGTMRTDAGPSETSPEPEERKEIRRP